MNKEDKRKHNVFGKMEEYYQWAREWDTVRASLKCSGKDLSKIKIVCWENKDGRNENN